MSDLSRATLARKLKSAGLHQARNKTWADGFTLVEFVDYWGVYPSVPGSGAPIEQIEQALNHLGLHWHLGNMIMVDKDQDQTGCGAKLTMGPTEGVLICAREKGHNLKHETADGIPFSGDDSMVEKYLY